MAAYCGDVRFEYDGHRIGWKADNSLKRNLAAQKRRQGGNQDADQDAATDFEMLQDRNGEHSGEKNE